MFNFSPKLINFRLKDFKEQKNNFRALKNKNIGLAMIYH